MRKLAILAFDDFVTDTPTVYTTEALNETLGAFDKLTIQAVCDSLNASPTLSVAIEQSGDQRNWLAKSPVGPGGGGGPEISGFTPTASAPSIVGADVSAAGSMGFVRLAITLGPAAATPSMHLKLWVTARDTTA